MSVWIVVSMLYKELGGLPGGWAMAASAVTLIVFSVPVIVIVLFLRAKFDPRLSNGNDPYA